MELRWGRLTRCFSERPKSVEAMFRGAVVADPEAIALVDGDARLTDRQLDRRADELAAGLVACGGDSAGVSSGMTTSGLGVRR
jgi:non-ribosomal peptide synthetase component E (peptide arylation enzyme)